MKKCIGKKDPERAGSNGGTETRNSFILRLQLGEEEMRLKVFLMRMVIGLLKGRWFMSL